MEYQDRQITCLDCGQPFVFTAGEQEFYSRKGFKEEPKRCKPCREQRKVRRDSGGFSSSPRPGGGNGNGNRFGYGGNGGGDVEDDIGNRRQGVTREAGRDPEGVRSGRTSRELFDAVCASCGGAARVPFRPVAGRPVYCRDCFSNQADGR